MKSLPKSKLGKVVFGLNISQITCLAPSMSYLVIICLNSHTKLGVGSNRITHLAHRIVVPPPPPPGGVQSF